MPKTMQIRTRRRRGRKISRRRPRKVSRRQSLSRRRLKSRSGGKQPLGVVPLGVVKQSTFLAPDPVHTKPTEIIDDAHKALARELLANHEIKAYLQNVVAKLKVKAGGEEKFEEAILKALKAAEVAAGQQGGAPSRLPSRLPSGDDDDGHDDDGRPSPNNIRNGIIRRIPQPRLQGINVVLLVGLIFMMFMIDQVDARRLGRGNTARIRTPAIDNMFNPYDPRRPDQIWSFFNALFSLFGYGPGAWGPDPAAFTGPRTDPTRFYGPYSP